MEAVERVGVLLPPRPRMVVDYRWAAERFSFSAPHHGSRGLLRAVMGADSPISGIRFRKREGLRSKSLVGQLSAEKAGIPRAHDRR